MRISPTIDTDLSRIETMLPRMGPITNPLPPATQSDILGILQREQDRAIALLSSSPLLASLFVSYANQAAALESASATPSPENEEWKALQNTIDTLHDEIKKLKSENLEMAGGLEAAGASQQAFHSQVSSLEEVNTTQQDDIKSLRAELTEAKDEYGRLLVNSNAEAAALQVKVLELETQRAELRDTIVEQQVKISKLERQGFSSLPGPTKTAEVRKPNIPEVREELVAAVERHIKADADHGAKAALITDQQRLGLNTPPVTLADEHIAKDVNYGCVWDEPNYSCAYDSAFMVTFSTYRYASSSWRQWWRDSSDFNGMLGQFFDEILTTMRIPLLCNQLPSLFNAYRDWVRDQLNEINPVDFPRSGQNPAAASDIFVCMSRLEGDCHLVSLKFACNDESHQPQTEGYHATFVLLAHNMSRAEHGIAEKPTLQQSLSSYFHEMRANPPQCQSCRTPFSSSSLSVAPLPWIWIDVPLGGDQLFTLSTTLTLEQESGPSFDYTLAGIVYGDGIHFSARFRETSERWWAYNGMLESGRPSLDLVTDDTQLTHLGGREMHVLVYRLNSTEPTMIAW